MCSSFPIFIHERINIIFITKAQSIKYIIEFIHISSEEYLFRGYFINIASILREENQSVIQ